MSAEEIISAQRARGAEVGRVWAASLEEPVSREVIIAEADRRWPYESANLIAAYNLSGGFIVGATQQFAGRSNTENEGK